LIKDPSYNVYWLERRPSFSDKVAEKLTEVFADDASDVEAQTVLIGNYELYAVRSGGNIFVQLFTIPVTAEERR